MVTHVEKIPNFPAFNPKNIRVTSTGSISKVTWSCDGKRIAVCGTEKLARVWTPEKSVSTYRVNQSEA